jgi:hypothetical protein
LINDLDEVIDNMRLELERTKANLYTGNSSAPISLPNNRGRNSEMLGCEENLVLAVG